MQSGCSRDFSSAVSELVVFIRVAALTRDAWYLHGVVLYRHKPKNVVVPELASLSLGGMQAIVDTVPESLSDLQSDLFIKMGFYVKIFLMFSSLPGQ